MPLTKHQESITRLLAKNRSLDSYLAGGSALHFKPNTKRYSNDLDYFHDSEERVAKAFEDDSVLLKTAGYDVILEMKQPGYIRATVNRENQSTKIEWAHDSAWRFMPVVYNEITGYQLHTMDIAVNKVLALAGRDEARDYLDVMHIHQTILPLGPLVWAACGKDPGFTPASLLELLKRRGKYREEDFLRLHLASAINLKQLKQDWLSAVASAEKFINSRPPDEIGCLYYSISKKDFVDPTNIKTAKDLRKHFGRPGGVLPKI